jgi:hypothetical protein
VLVPASLEPAVRGQNAVLSALGHKKFLGPSRILSEGTANVLRAMTSAGVPRFICESSLGVGAPRVGAAFCNLFVYPIICPLCVGQIASGKADRSERDRLGHCPPRCPHERRRPRKYRSGPKAGNYLSTPVFPRGVAAFMLEQLATIASSAARSASATKACYALLIA